jgi:hypothetical protein
MKVTSTLYLFLLVLLSVASCKKESVPLSTPTITYKTILLEGKANAQGEYEIEGHVSSVSRLEKITLTKEGQNVAFMIDNSTPKNKTEYDFNYLVPGITKDTYVIIAAIDQLGGSKTDRYLIKK